MSNVSKSLISLTKNEQSWAIRSGRSEEMSERERIAQVAQQKWATVSESLSSLKKMSDHEQIAQVGQRKWGRSS